jgi:cell division protein FtsW
VNASPATIERPQLRVVRAGERAPATRAEAAARRSVRLLVGSTVFLSVAGLIMVLSASSVYACQRIGSCFYFFQKQAAYAAVGALALVVTSRMRYQVWRRLALPMLLVTVALLSVVLHPAAGVEAYGASRWLGFGPVTVQPSEVAKLALVAVAAALLSRKTVRLSEPRQVLMPLAPVAALVCGLVFIQPDLGTAIVLGGSIFVLLFVAGARLRHLFLASFGLAATALLLLRDYQWERITVFLNPAADRMSGGWQLYQSLIALGSGGWFGVGLGASRQKWMYVPNAHTDFVFSILGEELGLVGETVVLIGFGVLLFAVVRIAAAAPDAFGRLLAAGIVGWFGIQIVVNLGAVTGLLPITGVPLPFLSYGGSSLVVSLAAVGILVNIARASGRASLRTPVGGGTA